jgi:F-type H+-transporting ATPase subunit delta
MEMPCSLALEEGNIEALWKEGALIQETLEENPEFLTIICHPEMTQEKKFSILEDVFKKDLSQEMMGLFQIMIKKGRIGDILSVLEYFDSKVKEHLKVGVVEITTPLPLTDEQKKQLEDRLFDVTDYKTLETSYEIDESLLGGMVIRIGDRVLDNSIRSKMEAMSRQLFKVKLS